MTTRDPRRPSSADTRWTLTPEGASVVADDRTRRYLADPEQSWPSWARPLRPPERNP